MTPCARSHSIPGQHAPGCTCTRECPDHDDHCRGCAPAEATKGLLCGRCSQRLRDNLGASEGLEEPGEDPIHGLPWAWEHLEHAYPSLSQAPGKGGSSVDDPEAERLAAVLSVRADICDVLRSWSWMLAEHLNLAYPEAKGQRLRVRRCAEWLLVHVEGLEASEAVDLAWEELADLMSRAHALAKWRAAPTKIDGSLCRCGAISSLHDHGTEIVCWSCRHNYSREEYRIMSTVFGRRYADDPRALEEAARARLAKVPEQAAGETETVRYGGRP